MSEERGKAQVGRRTPKRKRGVYVSWQAVDEAMQERGYHLITDLIAAVAAFEGKGDGMRSTIYQMHKGEQGVDRRSVERLARVLEVDADSLLRGRDASPLAAETGTTVGKRQWVMITMIIVFLGAFSILGWLQGWDAGGQLNVPQDSEPPKRVRDDLVMAFIEPEGPRSESLARFAVEASRTYWPLRSSTRWLDPQITLPSDVDRAIRVRTERFQDYLLVNVSVRSASEQSTVWSDVISTAASDQWVSRVMVSAIDSVRAFLVSGDRSNFREPGALTALAQGLAYQSAGRSELVVLRMESTYLKALRLAPNWGKALAGLCNAYVQQHMLAKAKHALEAAISHCESALEQERSPLVLNASGLLARTRGLTASAQQLFEESLALDPAQAGAMDSLAYLHLQRYRSGDGTGHREQALGYAAQLAKQYPDRWQSHYVAGYVDYVLGEPQQAVTHFRRALQLEQNNQIYHTLAGLEVCLGDFQAALETARSGLVDAVDDPVLINNLGTALFHVGEFTGAAREFERSIQMAQKQGGVRHTQWSNYGDALLFDGRREKALEAYNSALDTVDRKLVDEGKPIDEVARAVYETFVLYLRGVPRDDDAFLRVRQTLESFEWRNDDIERIALLSRAWYVLDDPSRVKALHESADNACPGYLQLPDRRLLVSQAGI